MNPPNELSCPEFCPCYSISSQHLESHRQSNGYPLNRFTQFVSCSSLSANYFVNRWTVVAGGNIAIGCLAALLVTTAHQRFREVLGSRPLLYLGAIFYASSLVPVLPHEHLRPFGIGFLIVWIYLNQSSRLTQFLEIRSLAYLGMISYGIYMYQGFFLSTGPTRFPGQEWPPHPIIGLILLCIVAPLSFHYFERPLMRLKSKFSVNQVNSPKSLGQTASDVKRAVIQTR